MPLKLMELEGDFFWDYFRSRGKTDEEIKKALQFSHDLMKPEFAFLRKLKLSQWELENIDMLLEYRMERERMKVRRKGNSLGDGDDIFDLDDGERKARE